MHQYSARIIFSLFTFFVAASLANATPPRQIHLSDIPVALNNTHLFLFRSVSDNHGSHYISDTRRYLISQSIVTGKVEHHWFLGRTNFDTIEECKQKCVTTDLTDALNPMHVLAEFEAVPIIVSPVVTWHEEDKFPSFLDSHYLSNEGLSAEAKEGTKIILPKNKLLMRIANSLGPTLTLLQQTSKNQDDPIKNDIEEYSHSLTGCITNQLVSNLSNQSLFELSCENDDLLAEYHIYFTLVLNADAK